MSNWLQDIKQILSREPETYLAYFYGRLVNKLPHLTEQPPPFRGFLFRLLIFFRFLIVNTRLRRQPSVDENNIKFFFFAGSQNQIDTLLPVLAALELRDTNYVCTATARLINTEDRFPSCRKSFFGVGDTLKSLWLLLFRGWGLYRELKAINPLLNSWYFNEFCYVYIYLSYFHYLLKKIQPEFVITANDHSVQNRCMLAVAHHLKIKTVYLQHASVSNLFPALRVNYAFLDGESALEIYRSCESNLPSSMADSPLPQVFLSGQKKQLMHNDENGKLVGIALNKLDDLDHCFRVCNELLNAGYRIRLRWHPRQAASDIYSIVKKLKGHQLVELNDPNRYQVGEFFSGMGVLIAGNSSIHLEAALSGIKPIYFELSSSPTKPDYYGYVAKGLTKKAETLDELIKLIKSYENPNVMVNSLAVKYYSHTFQTKWFGREGELVVDSLLKISIGVKLKDIFGYSDLYDN